MPYLGQSKQNRGSEINGFIDRYYISKLVFLINFFYQVVVL